MAFGQKFLRFVPIPNCVCDHKTSEATPWRGGKQLVSPFWLLAATEIEKTYTHWKLVLKATIEDGAKKIWNWNKQAMLISGFCFPKLLIKWELKRNSNEMGCERAQKLPWRPYGVISRYCPLLSTKNGAHFMDWSNNSLASRRVVHNRSPPRK